jgi:hypothetical protein
MDPIVEESEEDAEESRRGDMEADDRVGVFIVLVAKG